MGDLQEHEENCEIKTYGDVNMEVVIEAIMEINSKAQLQHFLSAVTLAKLKFWRGFNIRLNVGSLLILKQTFPKFTNHCGIRTDSKVAWAEPLATRGELWSLSQRTVNTNLIITAHWWQSSQLLTLLVKNCHLRVHRENVISARQSFEGLC